MKKAIELAKKVETDIPVAALIVKNGEIISQAFNTKEKNNDITYYKSYVYEMVEPFLSLPPSLRSPHRSLLALRHP